ncbi:glycine-rich protein DOT1-like [Miscanthus floridulus]|uniref:glycine-rich protein DOT1-like n=1 Tax=Miscanthus floridulus TaxID=154761 RepID=UPI00345AF7D6
MGNTVLFGWGAGPAGSHGSGDNNFQAFHGLSQDTVGTFQSANANAFDAHAVGGQGVQRDGGGFGFGSGAVQGPQGGQMRFGQPFHQQNQGFDPGYGGGRGDGARRGGQRQ